MTAPARTAGKSNLRDLLLGLLRGFLRLLRLLSHVALLKCEMARQCVRRAIRDALQFEYTNEIKKPLRPLRKY